MAKSAILAIRIVSDAKDAQKGFDKSASAADKWSSAMKKTALAAGTAVLAFGYKTAKTFEDVRRTLQVATGATGEALDGLVDSAKNVGTKVPAEFQAIADSLGTFNTLTGATGDQLERLSEQTLNAARLLGEDGVAASEAYGKSLKQWGVDAEQGAQSLDFLYTLTQDYGISLTKLSGDLVTYGSVMQNAGFTMDETADLFARLDSTGISLGRIMPGLNAAFRDWAKAQKDPQEELSKTVDAIKGAETAQQGLAIATEVFGAQGAQRLTTAIREGSFALEDLGAGFEGAIGAIDEGTEANRTLAESFDLLVNGAMVAIEPIATQVFGVLVDVLTEVAEWVGENETLFLVLAGVLVGIAATVATVSAAKTVWATATSVLTAGQWLLNAALSANPVGIVVVAIAALVAGLVLAYNKSESFRNIVDTVASFAATAFGWVWDAISVVVEWIGTMLDKAGGIGGIFETAMSIAKGAVEFLFSPFEFLIGLVEKLIGWISRIKFPSPPGWVTSLFGGAADPELVGIPRMDSVLRFLPAEHDMLTAAAVPALPALGRAGFAAPAAPVTMTNININVDGSGIVDKQKIADQIRDVLDYDDRVKGRTAGLTLGRPR